MVAVSLHDNKPNIKLIGSVIKRILKTTKQDRATHSMHFLLSGKKMK